MAGADGYIDLERTHVGDKEWRTADDTIAVLDAAEGDTFDTAARFDLNRLRRALIAYDEEFGGQLPYIGVQEIEHDNGDRAKVLTLAPAKNATRCVALAYRVDRNRGRSR